MSRLHKKLVDHRLFGKTRVPKGAILDVETGGVLKLAGTTVTADAGELNILDGVTATATELNSVADASARIVTSTATTLALTVTQHGERVVLVNTNSTVANTFTLPVATGSGAKFTIINGIAQTQGSVVVAANGTTDTLKGIALMVNTTVTNQAQAFYTTASSDKVSFNRTTTGGVGGDIVEAWDVTANQWQVQVKGFTAGTTATPFSET
jgi:hypothetical protein